MLHISFKTATLAVAVMVAAGCTATAGASELRVGFSTDALTLDPANHRNRETETIIRNLYDGLLTRNSRMQIVPEIAESYKQVDTTTYEFKLRQGISFHDGSAMTAEDIKFTFDRLTQEKAMDGQTSPRKGLLGPLTEVTIVDPQTVRFVLSEPWPILPAMLPFQEVVSKAFVEKVGSEGLATQVNGTGPFKLVEWRKGDSIIMERFDDYYGGAVDIEPVGKACVDRVIFQIIPESASRVAALLSGDVDIINELPAHSMNQVANNANTEVMTVRGTRTYFVALNNTKAPFDNPLVRKAANHALDKKLIIDKILSGTATPLNGVLSPDAFAFKADLPEYIYDVAKAKELLTEAGYPDGIDVTLDVDGPFKDTAEAVASLLSKAGIRTKVEVGESSLLVKKWREDEEKVGDMWFTSWGNGSLDPSDIVEPTLQTGGRGNSAGYSNAKVDELLKAASTELDRDKRIALYHEAQSIVNDDAPWLFLWLPQEIYGVSKRLSGWRPSADSRINLHDACVN